MTVRFRKKLRKWRGRTSHGWGAKKKRRGGGSQGGRGMGGTHKHKFSWVTSKAPDYFGYKGFHSKHDKVKSINVEDLEKMDAGNIDLGKMGYGKLLGRGRITRAVTVTVKTCSVQAKQKIEKAGGQVNTA